MTIKDLETGKTAVILKVGGEAALRQHFLDMGLIQGAEVTVVKYAPMGDPVEIRIHGYELTIRLDDAAKIEVSQPVEEKELSDFDDSVSNKSPRSKSDRPDSSNERYIDHPGLGEGGKYHNKEDEQPLPEGETITFALVGNQNCGKTTLFNVLTGSNQHIGNFPGVTVTS